jgi:hypothetical protein
MVALATMRFHWVSHRPRVGFGAGGRHRTLDERERRGDPGADAGRPSGTAIHDAGSEPAMRRARP